MGDGFGGGYSASSGASSGATSANDSSFGDFSYKSNSTAVIAIVAASLVVIGLMMFKKA